MTHSVNSIELMLTSSAVIFKCNRVVVLVSLAGEHYVSFQVERINRNVGQIRQGRVFDWGE
jgi:hypothetical protein